MQTDHLKQLETTDLSGRAGILLVSSYNWSCLLHSLTQACLELLREPKADSGF